MALEAGMVDGFLGRWSQRKQALRDGKPAPESDPTSRPVVPERAKGVVSLDEATQKSVGSAVGARPASNKALDGAQVDADALESSPKMPSLEDVKSLTPESDFSSFVARGVSPDVRNAAMKKLFADPHYSLIDGMDIYLEDYSLPSPLSVAMMAKMVSAKTLKLVDDPESNAALADPSKSMPDEAAPAPVSSTQMDADSDNDNDTLGSVTASAVDDVDTGTSSPSPTRPLPTEAVPLKDSPHHDHLDLRLQPNHAAGADDAGRGIK